MAPSPTASATKLVELLGQEKGKAVKYAEAFEVCEYGTSPRATSCDALPVLRQGLSVGIGRTQSTAADGEFRAVGRRLGVRRSGRAVR